MLRFRLVVLSVLVALLAACGGGGGSNSVPTTTVTPTAPLPPSSRITFVTDQSAILSGPRQSFQFSATDSNGTPISWSSSNTSVATVNATGQVTTTASSGSALIVASSGSDSAYATVIIAQPSAGTLLIPSPAVLSVTTSSTTLQATSLTKTLVPGNIVVGGTMNGLLATVRSVTTNGQQVILQTSPATLASAFPNMHADFTLPPTTITGTSSPAVSRVYGRSAREPTSTSTTFGPVACTVNGAPFPAVFKPTPSFSISALKVNPFINFDTVGGVGSLTIGATPDLSATAQSGSLNLVINPGVVMMTKLSRIRRILERKERTYESARFLNRV
jgi:hypothetical protein